MTNRVISLLITLALGLAPVRGDEPTAANAHERVVEGTVLDPERKPVEGARVFFTEPDRGFGFDKDATATTDGHGRYRADLGAFPWSRSAMQMLLLAPGFQIAERTVAPGVGRTRMDVDLVAQPWKPLQVRLQDGAGRPVAGVDVNCSVGGVSWARLKTDAEGLCRISMAVDSWLELSADPDGARPVQGSLAVSKDGLDSITLPVLPPYRGRVLDPQGRPVPDVAVGRWITFDPDGSGEMLPFLGGAKAVTDREGNFVIAPALIVRGYLTRPSPPNVEGLCFADSSCRRIAFRSLDPSRSSQPLEVTLSPARRIRMPTTLSSINPSPGATLDLSSQVFAVPHPDRGDLRFYLLTRDLDLKGPAPGAGEGPVLEESLPAGTYLLDVKLYDKNTKREIGQAQRGFVVPGGEGPLELPALDVGPTRFQQMECKPAPEIAATDLDTGRPVTLAEFRGNVVVLDFWGYWCGPCTGNMPHLVELQRKFEGRPLAIIALHDQSVQSRAEYDRMIAPARQRIWGGHDLPFRVLLDRVDPETPADRVPEGNGTTIQRYGIEGFPTLCVLDQDGMMVGRVGHWEHDRLESLVRELLHKAKAP
jgi:thiol-disulfide isomerase/thioredoxin